MKRIKILIFTLIILLFPTTVKATNEEIFNSFNNFINYYNEGNKNIYDLIDKNNNELYSNIKYNLYKSYINYNSYEIVEENDKYKLIASITADGRIYNSKWSINNQYVVFYYNKVNDEYILTDTTFFETTGINLLRRSYKKIYFKVILISYLSFIILMIIISLISHKISKSDNKTI